MTSSNSHHNNRTKAAASGTTRGSRSSQHHPKSYLSLYKAEPSQLTPEQLKSLLESSAYHAHTLETADNTDPLIKAIDILTLQLAILAGHEPLDLAALSGMRRDVASAIGTFASRLERERQKRQGSRFQGGAKEQLTRLAWQVAFLHDRKAELDRVARENGLDEYWSESVVGTGCPDDEVPWWRGY